MRSIRPSRAWFGRGVTRAGQRVKVVHALHCGGNEGATALRSGRVGQYAVSAPATRSSRGVRAGSVHVWFPALWLLRQRSTNTRPRQGPAEAEAKLNSPETPGEGSATPPPAPDNLLMWCLQTCPRTPRSTEAPGLLSASYSPFTPFRRCTSDQWNLSATESASTSRGRWHGARPMNSRI